MNSSIVVGADHRGYKLKEFLKQSCRYGDHSVTWHDCGAFDAERSDYPIFAHLVCQQMLTDHIQLGVLLCGSGIGMAIAANRFEGIRAGVAWNVAIARMAREDDDCNILVIPADVCDAELARELVAAWLGAAFKGGRYAERIAMLE